MNVNESGPETPERLAEMTTLPRSTKRVDIGSKRRPKPKVQVVAASALALDGDIAITIEADNSEAMQHANGRNGCRSIRRLQKYRHHGPRWLRELRGYVGAMGAKRANENKTR